MQFNQFIKNFQKHFELEEVYQIAQRTQFVKREPKKIAPLNFIISLFMCMFDESKTYENNAEKIGTLINDTVSKQAVEKRTKKETVDWLKEILLLTLIKISNIKQHAFFNSDLFSKFNRVIFNDSTYISVSPKLYDYYGGSKNQTKKKTATLKIQAYVDILKEQFCHFEITPYNKNDQAASYDIFDVAQPYDLIIRDLGYFTLTVFKKIVENSIYFISRLRSNTALFLQDCKTELNLLDYLKKHKNLEYIDINILVGKKEKLPARLVANKLPKDEAKKRKRKALKNRDRRCNISKTNLQLLGWEIYITNILPTVWDAKTVCEVYRLRWRIEIIFKSWKSFFRITNVPDAKIERVECYLYFTLIAVTLIHSYIYVKAHDYIYLKHNRFLSLLRFAKYMKEQAWTLPIHFSDPNGLHNLFKQLAYYGVYNKRHDRVTYPQRLMALG